MSDVARFPRPLASFVAVLAAVASVFAVIDRPPQALALGVTVAGVVAIGIAGAARRRGRRFVALGVGILGAGLGLAGVAAGLALPAEVPDRVEVAPGLVGVTLLALGLAPARAASPRRFVSVGTAFLVANVALSGLVHGAELWMLLGGFTAAVVAWDVGEQAINVGEQLGVRARTWQIEASHAAATGAYGALAVGAAAGFRQVEVTGVPLVGLLLLVTASIALLVALYN